MGAMAQRMALGDAEQIAAEILTEISPLCERIEIAGSVRRRANDVGDIEIVCVPQFSTRTVGLFDDSEAINVLDEALRMWCEPGRQEITGWRIRYAENGSHAFGAKSKRLTYKDVPVDLFSVIEPAQWGVIMAIRTGPAIFSHRFVSHLSVELPDHSRGTLPFEMLVKDGQLWSNGHVIETPTEESFFEAIGMRWVDPECRR